MQKAQACLWKIKPERLTQTDWRMDENHGNRLFSKQFIEARSETKHLGKDSFVLINAYQHLRRPKFLSNRCVKRACPCLCSLAENGHKNYWTLWWFFSCFVVLKESYQKVLLFPALKSSMAPLSTNTDFTCTFRQKGQSWFCWFCVQTIKKKKLRQIWCPCSDVQIRQRPSYLTFP